MKKILFIDRDGTIIREPEDEQIDSFEKLQFVPRAISNLVFLRQHTDYLFVMVSNQERFGNEGFSRRHLLARTELHHRHTEGRGSGV